MVSLCTNSPLPTFKSLYDSFEVNLTFPPQGFTFPALPTLPSPMFPSISVPNLEAIKTVAELQSQQIMGTAMAMIQPMIDLLGLDLGAILPKIPYIDVSLTDLLAGDPSVLFQKIKDRLLTGLPNPAWPFIPTPFYFELSMPDISVAQIAGNLVKDYMKVITGFIEGLVGQVTSFLEIAGMPALPTFPSFEDIEGLILGKVSGATNFLDAIKNEIGLSVSELFDITIPGFPALPALPSPLVPSIGIPEFDFQESMGILMNHLNTTGLQLVMNFIDSTLGAFLSFSFPTMCINL